MNKLARHKATKQLSKTMEISFRQANEILDKMSIEAKKPLGTN